MKEQKSGNIKQNTGAWKIVKGKQWSGGGACVCSSCNYGFAFGVYFEPERWKYCPICGDKKQ